MNFITKQSINQTLFNIDRVYDARMGKADRSINKGIKQLRYSRSIEH